MPTQKLYKKLIEIIMSIQNLGLNGWDTELRVTNKDKEILANVKIKLQVKKLKSQSQDSLHKEKK